MERAVIFTSAVAVVAAAAAAVLEAIRATHETLVRDLVLEMCAALIAGTRETVLLREEILGIVLLREEIPETVLLQEGIRETVLLREGTPEIALPKERTLGIVQAPEEIRETALPKEKTLEILPRSEKTLEILLLREEIQNRVLPPETLVPLLDRRKENRLNEEKVLVIAALRHLMRLVLKVLPSISKCLFDQRRVVPHAYNKQGHL